MLGEKIHRMRKEKGMSQEELASQLTVSRQAISKWELGESMPDTENVIQLSKLFGVSTDYLLNDEYQSDTDIPAVKENGEKLKTEYRKRTKKASYWLIGIGMICILTMWILSSAIPVMKAVPYQTGERTYINAETGEVDIVGDDDTIWYTPREVRGDLGAFLETFSLIPIFTLCCALVLAGVIMMLYASKKKLKKENELKR